MPMFSLRYIVAHQHGRPVGISHGELQNTSAWRVRPGSKRHLATAVYPRLKHLRTHKTIVTCVVSNGKFFTSIHRFSSSDRLCKQSGHTCKELSIGYNTSNHRFVPSEMSRGRPPVRPRGALSVAAATSGPGKLSPLPAGTAAPMFSLRYISLSVLRGSYTRPRGLKCDAQRGVPLVRAGSTVMRSVGHVSGESEMSFSKNKVSGLARSTGDCLQRRSEEEKQWILVKNFCKGGPKRKNSGYL